MLGPQILIWLHLCAMAAYVGAQFAVIYMLLPAAETAPDESSRRKSLIAGFKFYNPFTIAVLGIIVITGAMRLTDLKASMKFDYFARIGAPLELKLGLAFLLIFIQTYITFGLAFRIGRQEEVAAHGDGEAFTVQQVNSMLRRIRAMVWFTILLAAAIIWVSLTMVSRAADVSPIASRISARIALRALPAFSCLVAPMASARDCHHLVHEPHQAADDEDNRHRAEDRYRHLVQYVVTCEPGRLADRFFLGRLANSGQPCFFCDCAHFSSSVKPVSLIPQTLTQAPTASSRCIRG